MEAPVCVSDHLEGLVWNSRHHVEGHRLVVCLSEAGGIQLLAVHSMLGLAQLLGHNYHSRAPHSGFPSWNKFNYSLPHILIQLPLDFCLPVIWYSGRGVTGVRDSVRQQVDMMQFTCHNREQAPVCVEHGGQKVAEEPFLQTVNVLFQWW